MSISTEIAQTDVDYFEVVNGFRVAIAPMGAFAGTVASLLVSYLNQFALPRKLGWAISEVLFDLGAGRNQRRPDLAFIGRERWQRMERRPAVDPPAWRVVPNLAGEVVSPSNTAAEIETKLLEYFDAGVEIVWVLHPVLRRFYVYDSPTSARVLTSDDVLDGGCVLPGFQLRLADFFDAMPPL
ncbi:MAG: Uma2 family endonuclease [Gemmataceae bacterium]